LSLKGTPLIAGGNAPGILHTSPDPERVARFYWRDLSRIFCNSRRFDPFRVDTMLELTGGVAPGY
jgi:hypothetical protein